MQKQTCFNKEIQPNLKRKTIIITQLFYNIKKSHQFISSLQYEKKPNNTKEKKLKRKKSNWKYLKRKKNKG